MKKSTIAFSVINVLAMLWLLGFVLKAKGLAIAEERDAYDYGDSLNYLIFVQPVLLLCVVCDIIWGGKALLAVIRRRGFQEAVACAVAVALWAVVWFGVVRLSELPSNHVLQRTASPPAEL